MIAGMLALTSLPLTAQASDSAAVLRGLMQIQGILEKSERDAAREREAQQRQEAAELQRAQAQQAQEARLKQAQNAEAQRARDAELAALMPPAQWAGNLVINRHLLEHAPDQAQQASIRIVGTHSASIAADGSHLAYLTEGRLILRELPSGRERVLRSDLDRNGWYFPSLPAGTGTLLLSGNTGAELMDLQGERLQQWLEPDIQAWANKGSIVVTKQNFPERFCSWVAHHDARTGEARRQLLLNPQAEVCFSRVNREGQLEVLAIDGDTVSHYVDGEQRQRFTGDTRGGDRDTYLMYHFVGELPYVVSHLNTTQPGIDSYRVWDLTTGKLLCELPRSDNGFLVASPGGEPYITSPPALVNLPSCEHKALASNGKLNIEGGLAFQYQPGEVLVRTLPDLAVKHRLKVGVTGEYVTLRRVPSQPRYLAVGNLSTTSQEDESTEFFDLENGKRVQTLPGRLSHSGPYTELSTFGHRTGEKANIQLWKVNLGQAGTDTIEIFLAALKKDKYETAAEYRARTHALSAPFEMDIQVKDYNAEAGHFVGEWRGLPIGIPLAAGQARQLDGLSPLTVKGQLTPVDDEFLELRDASIQLPDGSSLPVSRKSLPPRAAAVTTETLPAQSPTTSTTAKKPQASNCTGTLAHLAPQLRPYTDPVLADVRQAILNSPIQRETAQSALQNAARAEYSAAEAARTAQDTDGGGNSIARADSGSLPLGWPCEGIHASAVCVYIAHSWEALAYREIAAGKGCGGN